MDVGRCWWAQVAACGMRRCLRTLVAVCAAFSGARERRPVLRTPPPFRAAHGACRSACPLAARPHPPVVVRASPPARWPHAPRPSAAPRAASPLDIPPQRCYYNIAFRGGMAVCGASDWVWRSLVACLNGVQEAGGSNPLTQTTASEQSPLCSDVFFAFGRCICHKKAAVAPLPCSSFSAKGPARLACSLASALTTARCRYQPFAAAAPCESNRGGALAGAGLLDGQGPLARKRTGPTHRDDSRTRAGPRTRRRRAGGHGCNGQATGVRVLLGTRSAHAYTAGTGEASLIATAKAAAAVPRGAPEGQSRAQRQLFLANNRPVCYNVDRWSACPAPLPGCGHPLWRTYPFPPE